MPIEIKEVHITVTVEPVTFANGGDEALRTQFGNNNAYSLDPTPLDGQDAMLAGAIDDGLDARSGWVVSPYQDAFDPILL